jgi:hypothetical protein
MIATSEPTLRLSVWAEDLFLTFLLSFPLNISELLNTSSTVTRQSTHVPKLNSRDIHNHLDERTRDVIAPDSDCTRLYFQHHFKQRGKNPKYAGSFVHRRHSQSCLRGRTQNAHGHHANLIRRHPTRPPSKSGQRPPRLRSPTRRFLPRGRCTRHTLHHREVPHPIPSPPFIEIQRDTPLMMLLACFLI